MKSIRIGNKRISVGDKYQDSWGGEGLISEVSWEYVKIDLKSFGPVRIFPEQYEILCEYVFPEIPSTCECGAKYTSFPNNHLPFCPRY